MSDLAKFLKTVDTYSAQSTQLNESIMVPYIEPVMKTISTVFKSTLESELQEKFMSEWKKSRKDFLYDAESLSSFEYGSQSENKISQIIYDTIVTALSDSINQCVVDITTRRIYKIMDVPPEAIDKTLMSVGAQKNTDKTIRFEVNHKIYVIPMAKSLLDHLASTISVNVDPSYFKLTTDPTNKVTNPTPTVFLKKMLKEIQHWSDNFFQKSNKTYLSFIQLLIHEITHIQQFTRQKVPFSKINKETILPVGKKFSNEKLNYLSRYSEIDAFANDYAVKVILANNGARIELNTVLEHIQGHNYESIMKFSKEHKSAEVQKHMQQVFKRFIRTVIKNINAYNDALEAEGSK